MTRMVDLDALMDAADVAAALGLSSQRAVSTYQSRYADFPAPVWASRGGRCQLWLRDDVLRWHAQRKQHTADESG